MYCAKNTHHGGLSLKGKRFFGGVEINIDNCTKNEFICIIKIQL